MAKNRGLDWLVSARGYAMMIIYIGHVMLAYYVQGNTSLATVGNILQTGVIPFFIVLSGAFFSIGKTKFTNFFYLKFCQRILPVIFYSLILIPIYWVVNEKLLVSSLSYWPIFFLGIPLLNWPTWFLIALFTSELVYLFIHKKSWNKQQTLIIATILYILGWLFNDWRAKQGILIDNISMAWMINSLPLFLACLLLGKVYRKDILKLSRWSQQKTYAYFLIAFISLIGFCYLNNDFPENTEGFRKYLNSEMVMLFVGQYGHPVYFFISTLAGIVCCFLLARILPVTKFSLFVGDNSMLLLGLNAIFHHAFNWYIAKYLPLPADTPYWGMLYGTILGISSVIALAPLVYVLKTYLPQVTGKPMLKGPLLPAIYRK